MKTQFSALFFSVFFLLGAQSVNAKTYHYLSVDSGGMLGIIPARLLANVEAETGKQSFQLFDGMLGTSTGSMITSLLSVPMPGGALPYSASKVEEFYTVRGASIFQAASNSAVAAEMAAAFGKEPDFSNAVKVLGDNANEVFGSRTLSHALVDLSIVARDTTTGQLHLFSKHEAMIDATIDVLIRDAVIASSSVPMAFGNHQMNYAGRTAVFADAGAQGYNDPTYLAYHRVLKMLRPGDTAVIYSLGTGFMETSSATLELMANPDPRITLIRIQPSIQHLIMTRDCPLSRNLLSSRTSPATLNKFRAIADGLLTSPEYQQMLTRLKAKAAELGHDEL